MEQRLPMTRNSEKETVGCFFIFVIFATGVVMLILGGLFGEKIGRETMQMEAIKRGAAQYNPVTSQFEWKSSVKGEIDE